MERSSERSFKPKAISLAESGINR